MKKLSYEAKEQMVKLAGACFWFWDSYHSFLQSCGVPGSLVSKYPQSGFNKYSVMRNVLTDLENDNRIDIINNIVSGFYRLNAPIDKDNIDVEKAKQLLTDFRMAVGKDPIERAIHEEEKKREIDDIKQAAAKAQSKSKERAALYQQFMSAYQSATMTPQEKGYELERILFELLSLEEFDFRKPFRGIGEQIDGKITHEKFDYLVEVKWLHGPAKQDDMSVFDGKIRGKAQSTRGLFLSMNGFDDHAIRKYSGDSPRIVLMDGTELMHILDGRRSFYDCLQFKIDALVRLGDIYRKE
jgi:hypothetical protein